MGTSGYVPCKCVGEVIMNYIKRNINEVITEILIEIAMVGIICFIGHSNYLERGFTTYNSVMLTTIIGLGYLITGLLKYITDKVVYEKIKIPPRSHVMYEIIVYIIIGMILFAFIGLTAPAIKATIALKTQLGLTALMLFYKIMINYTVGIIKTS